MKTSKDDLEKLLEAHLKKDDGETTGSSVDPDQEVEVTPPFKVKDSRSRSDFKGSDSSVVHEPHSSGPKNRFTMKGSASPRRMLPSAGSSEERLAGALEMIARNQSMPQLHPPQQFSGDKRKDKTSLSEFLKTYARCVANCSEEDKVSLLAEYLVGEARRAYKCELYARRLLGCAKMLPRTQCARASASPTCLVPRSCRCCRRTNLQTRR